MSLRRAHIDDFEPLLKLNRSLIDVNPLSRERLRHYLSSPTCYVALIENKAAIEGAAIAEFHRHWKRAYLATIFVAREAQGKGHARILIQALESEARARGMKRFASHAAIHNKASIAFHEKTGFRRIKTIEGYYDDGSSAIFFTKEL